METTDQRTTPRASVFLVRPGVTVDHLTFVRANAVASGQTVAGQTDHVVVYTDGTPDGNATAQALLQTCEADYLATQAWFGGIDLPPGQEGDDQTVPRTALPVHVLIDPQAGGAYHFGCNATDLYIEPTPDLASGLFVAELVECFQAAINNGWDCGQTNGEGLSRVLAGERNANLDSLFVQTEQGWWADGQQDYVTDNSADDSDQDGNGCGTLFLYYLHSQLDNDWTTIATTGGSSLGDTYTRLAGNDAASGFNDFVSRLATLDSGGTLNVPTSGNPFPISGTAPAAGPGSEQPNQQPAGQAPGQAPQQEPEPVPAAAAEDVVVVEREIDIIAVPEPAAVEPAEAATAAISADADAADASAAESLPENTPPAAALERTAPIIPHGLDASGTAGSQRRGVPLLAVLVLVILVIAAIIVLIATGVIHL
jgi:hypothetical protein